jgi:hypothetical protein
MRYCNAYTSTTALSHLGRERIYNEEWNWFTATSRDLGWKCILDEAAWSRKLNVSSSCPKRVGSFGSSTRFQMRKVVGR